MSKKEQRKHSVGSSANGSMKAVRRRGMTYRSLLPASMKGKRLEPSTRSPEVRMEWRYSSFVMTKFSVFSLPSAAGYMKLTMPMPLSLTNAVMSASVNSAAGFPMRACMVLERMSISMM